MGLEKGQRVLTVKSTSKNAGIHKNLEPAIGNLQALFSLLFSFFSRLDLN